MDGTSRIFQAIEEDAVLKQRFRSYEFACQYASGRALLEIGCELGVGAYYLAEKARFVLGIDKSGDWIEQALALFRRDNLHFAVMDGAHVGAADGSFDVVVLFEVIEHVVSPGIVLGEARRTLAPGGLLLLSTPNRLSMAADPSQLIAGEHLREFSYSELQELVAGFHTECEFFGQRLVDIMPLEREVGFPRFAAFSRFVVMCRR